MHVERLPGIVRNDRQQALIGSLHRINCRSARGLLFAVAGKERKVLSNPGQAAGVVRILGIRHAGDFRMYLGAAQLFLGHLFAYH